ncbi:uncharacterized protein LOC105198968 [Solenopsis invicta]|uniref:uncharacterized protein LOC105198968 n=1 Tax=Solenopsis invicta TaxID=13686 RepID=UPI000595BB02|nr:uncharacterized protein LOC105198968 [Solenopsis invicta]
MRTDALLGLMPNLRGPRVGAKRAYAYVVMAGALYGAPVWFREALASRRIRETLHAVQRRLARRIVRAYRIASSAATMILASLPPAEFTADALAWCYARAKVVRLQRGREVVTPRVAALLRERVRRRAMDTWQENLANDPPAAGSRILKAILPYLDKWVGRPWAADPTGRHRCSSDMDSQEVCLAWNKLCGVLRAEIGDDLFLRAIITQMVRRESTWIAVSSFCEQVMRQKVEAKKQRGRRPGRRMPFSDNNDNRGGGDGDHDQPWLSPQPPRKRRKLAPRPPGP